MAHPYHQHREQQVAHRRVKDTILKDEPSGAASKLTGKAFSNVTSKSAAQSHDGGNIGGGPPTPGRFKRGGKVGGKGGHHTNIAIVVPGGGKGMAPPPGGAPVVPPGMPPVGAAPPAGNMGPPHPMPPPPMGGGMPGMGPPPPGGMPMHASGGRIKGESTKANIATSAARAKKNTNFYRGGAATGVGREEKAAKAK